MLDFPSRLMLVKSVLQTMSSYVFSVHSDPKLVINKIREIQRNYLWGSTEIQQKWALVDWEMVCKPKRFMGLGLRDLEIANKVLSTKIWWSWVIHMGKTWANFWNLKYARGRTSQNLIWFDHDAIGSPIWQAANANRHLVKDHSFWKIGNGEEADFFRDSWQQLPKLQGVGDPLILQVQLERGGFRKVKDF